ncbi:hypothetical protein PHMEG_00033849, partial [Phytophthora megakarya]
MLGASSGEDDEDTSDNWDAEGAYDGAFEDDAADLDDRQDEDYAPDLDIIRPAKESRKGMARNTRVSRRRILFENSGADSSCENDKATPISSVQGKQSEASAKPQNQGEEVVDRLLGMNTIVPDNDAAFLKGFPDRWRSWEFFHEQFDIFTASTYQRIPVRSTTSVEKRNKQILGGNKSVKTITVDWKVYSKTLKCTHGIKQQKRGDGQCQHNVIRFTGCTAQVNATLQMPHALSVLREFIHQEEGNSASFFVEEATEVAQVVVFQSARMKRLFQAFPEVVLVDTTHDTHANQYKLFSFMMTDFFGKGQYVQHAWVKAETKEHLRLAIMCFQENNPFWTKVKVFVTDKAFHEKAVLAEAFPESRQLLCLFHVVAWLEKQAAKLSTGTALEKEKLKAALSALVYSTSQRQYDEDKHYLLKVLKNNEDHELYRFFMVNWDVRKEEWALFERGNVPHWGNHTNNRLESKWGKIKQI